MTTEKPKFSIAVTSMTVQELNADYEDVGPLHKFTGEQVQHLWPKGDVEPEEVAESFVDSAHWGIANLDAAAVVASETETP